MTAVTPGREELLALADEMEAALKKHRSADSPEIMVRAHAALGSLFYGHIQPIIDGLRLAAKPADDGVREATIEECAKIAERAANRCVREQIPGDSVATFCAQQIRALSTPGAPKQ